MIPMRGLGILVLLCVLDGTLEYSTLTNSVLQEQLNLNLQQFVPEVSVLGVVGGTVDLPCHTAPPKNSRDSIKLVLWFKDDSSRPIYTYDTRGNKDSMVRHWSNTTALEGRAFFRGTDSPANLVLDALQVTDAGLYKCRVDFFKVPTQISRVKLNIIVPPEKPRVFNKENEEVKVTLGPYRIGERVEVKCEVWGGSPSPQLYWWRDHALLDSTYERSGPQKIMNVLVLDGLERSDLHSILTCQASNNNLSAPVSTSVKIDMHFGPLSVRLVKGRETLSAGKRYEAKCEVVGARPTPRISWWRGTQQIRDNITIHSSPDGNMTLSTVIFVPQKQDEGKFLGCRAADQRTGEGSLEDGWKLNVNYVPEADLSLGASLNGSNIREGDDVYFECNVRSNPRPYKITWRRNENILVQNLGLGIIISNQSLVLQRVGRLQSGIYTCLAHNTEGDGVSNPITLNVRYAPYCKQNQQFVYGVARNEKTRVVCEVMSNPSTSLSFHWVFNTSADKTDIQETEVNVMGSVSTIDYTPRNEMDYGNLLCWGRNSVGVQQNPCIFHLIPAGRPDPVHNCTVHNQTLRSMIVSCGSGFDGGLAQEYQLLVRSGNTHSLLMNLTSRTPEFKILDLRPGEGYILTIFSHNSKGRSEPMNLHAFTLKDQSPQLIVADPSRQPGDLTFTPVLGILIAVAGGIALVAVCIVVVMRIKYAHKYSANMRAGRPNYVGTHIPLTKTGSNNPDLIPTNEEYIEEEEAFHNFHERKYATVGRQKQDSDFEKYRHRQRQSRDLTYTELTLPRSSRGYSTRRHESGRVYTRVNTASPSPLPEDLHTPLLGAWWAVWSSSDGQESTL